MTFQVSDPRAQRCTCLYLASFFFDGRHFLGYLRAVMSTIVKDKSAIMLQNSLALFVFESMSLLNNTKKKVQLWVSHVPGNFLPI